MLLYARHTGPGKVASFWRQLASTGVGESGLQSVEINSSLLRDTFELWDLDGNGSIDRFELTQVHMRPSQLFSPHPRSLLCASHDQPQQPTIRLLPHWSSDPFHHKLVLPLAMRRDKSPHVLVHSIADHRRLGRWALVTLASKPSTR